jgi:hypothetical protein
MDKVWDVYCNVVGVLFIVTLLLIFIFGGSFSIKINVKEGANEFRNLIENIRK